MNQSETFYGYNNDDFDSQSPEEAAQAAWENSGDYEIGTEINVYEMDFNSCRIEEFLTTISETIEEQTYDEIGERALDVAFSQNQSKSLQEAVEAAVCKWGEENDFKLNLWRPIGESRPIKMRFTDEFGEAERAPEPKRIIRPRCGNHVEGQGDCGTDDVICERCAGEQITMTDDQIRSHGYNPDHYPIEPKKTK